MMVKKTHDYFEAEGSSGIRLNPAANGIILKRGRTLPADLNKVGAAWPKVNASFVRGMIGTRLPGRMAELPEEG